jgi:CBS domain containing-hemolysin-like protein
MNDSDSRPTPTASPSTALVPVAQEPNPEPGSSPASAPAQRGPTLWNRLKSLLALRTVSLRDDLEVALESDTSSEAADFTPAERTILQNVLQLGEKRVEDVMVPRADIVAIDAEENFGTLVARFRQVGHSRIPVYEDSLDRIAGFIHVKDALRRITDPVADPEKDVPIKLVSSGLRSKVAKLDLIRPVLFVPPLMPVGDLLAQMRQQRLHMAIVIDEYGGTDGLVTIEDVLEAVVGEIEDEHDDLDTSLVRRINSNVFVASARAELDEARAVIGPDFDPGAHADEVDTIGGLVFDLAGRVPAKGEVVTGLKGFEFEVMLADSRQIKRLKIKRVKQRPARPPGTAKSASDGADETQAAAE